MRTKILFSLLVGVLWLWSATSEAASGYWSSGSSGAGGICNGEQFVSLVDYGECLEDNTALPGGACEILPYVELTFLEQPPGSGTWNGQLRIDYSYPSPACGSSTAAATWNMNISGTTGLCEGWDVSDGCPPECDTSQAGEKFRKIKTSLAPPEVCETNSQCKATTSNQLCLGDPITSCLVAYTITDENCGGGAPSETQQVVDASPGCIVSAGTSVCVDPESASGCGYVNESYVCVEAIPAGNCVFMSDGGMACASDADAPPAPDNGATPGTVATPDGVVSNSSNTTNIFNQSTVNNSLGTAQGSDPTPGGGSDGEGSGEGGDEDFAEIIEEAPDEGSYDDGIEGAVTELDNDLQGILDELGDPADFAGEETLSDSIGGAMGVSGCVDIEVPVGAFNATFTCAAAAPIRDWLGWICGMLFLFGMFNLITQRPV